MLLVLREAPDEDNPAAATLALLPSLPVHMDVSMILGKTEHAQLQATLADLEAVAAMMSPGSARDAIYRNVATLRRLLRPSAILRDGRADGHPC